MVLPVSTLITWLLDSVLFSGKPCLGYPEDEDEHLLEEFLVSQTPVPRKISKMCHRVLGKEADGNAHSCSECLKIRETKATWDINVAAKCKAGWPDGYCQIFTL